MLSYASAMAKVAKIRFGPTSAFGCGPMIEPSKMPGRAASHKSYGTAPMYCGASGSHGERACITNVKPETHPTSVIDVTVAALTGTSYDIVISM